MKKYINFCLLIMFCSFLSVAMETDRENEQDQKKAVDKLISGILGDEFLENNQESDKDNNYATPYVSVPVRKRMSEKSDLTRPNKKVCAEIRGDDQTKKDRKKRWENNLINIFKNNLIPQNYYIYTFISSDSKENTYVAEWQLLRLMAEEDKDKAWKIKGKLKNILPKELPNFVVIHSHQEKSMWNALGFKSAKYFITALFINIAALEDKKLLSSLGSFWVKNKAKFVGYKDNIYLMNNIKEKRKENINTISTKNLFSERKRKPRNMVWKKNFKYILDEDLLPEHGYKYQTFDDQEKTISHTWISENHFLKKIIQDSQESDPWQTAWSLKRIINNEIGAECKLVITSQENKQLWEKFGFIKNSQFTKIRFIDKASLSTHGNKLTKYWKKYENDFI